MVLAVPVLAGCSLVQPLVTAGQNPALIGRPAPTFNGTDLDGHLVRLAQFNGKPLVINFWASWCGPCRAEQPDLTRVAHDYAPRGLAVLGVDVRDDAGQARIFRDEFKMPYPSLYDQAGRLEFAYQVDAPPSTVFINAAGVIMAKITGQLDGAAMRRIIDDRIYGPGGTPPS